MNQVSVEVYVQTNFSNSKLLILRKFYDADLNSDVQNEERSMRRNHFIHWTFPKVHYNSKIYT